MYAMQYRITLPSDYDMSIIRERVARTGHLMDGFDGLGFKVYGIQEKACGVARNAYAPFYLWHDVDGMRAFCWGEMGYASIVRDFGRHPIQDWTVHRSTPGLASAAQAKSLRIKTLTLPDGSAPSEVLPNLTDDFHATAGSDVVWKVSAVDVTSWSLILVTVATTPVDYTVADVDSYELLHISLGDNSAR